MNKYLHFMIMIAHFTVALFFANQLYSFFANQLHDDSEIYLGYRLFAVFVVTLIAFVVSCLVYVKRNLFIYSFFSYVLIIGLLAFMGNFLFSGVYACTLTASILLLLDERNRDAGNRSRNAYY